MEEAADAIAYLLCQAWIFVSPFSGMESHGIEKKAPIRTTTTEPPSNHPAIIQVVVGHNGDQAQSTDPKESYVRKFQPAIETIPSERR